MGNAPGPEKGRGRGRELELGGGGGGLAEGADGLGFVIGNVKDGVELGDLHDVMDLAGEVEQLHIALMLADGGEGADKGAEAGAVDVGDVVKIEKDLLLAFGEEIG